MAMRPRSTETIKMNTTEKHYAAGYVAWVTRVAKNILNLGFMEEYGDTGINYGHIVFHEIGHAVNLGHKMIRNGIPIIDFSDNVMAGEIDLLDENGDLYRLRNMWITD